MTPITKDWLKQYGQEHLLSFEPQWTNQQRLRMLSQLESIDFSLIRRLAANNSEDLDWSRVALMADAPPSVRIGQEHRQFASQSAKQAGEAALRSGQIGMILVAGGQGTRLGFDRPKGLYSIGPLSGRTLFQMHVDRLLAVMKRYQVSIPMYVMTSPATDADTRAYFDQESRLGLNVDQLHIFCQGTMPAIDAASGRILLSGPAEIAVSPDGHGGLVSAMASSGCFEHARQRGIDHFFYAQVDNPLVEVCDPLLIGYHLLSRSQMTTQVVRKRFPKEKVGNVVSIDGKVQIIEYSDLPDAVAEQTLPDGSLKLWAGNIAVHVFDRGFLESVVDSVDGLPFHRARKAVPFVNDDGQLVKPASPNAIKFERFIFDLLPLAERAFVVEADAANVFAPVKNADGESVDTPADTRRALLALHRRWLTHAGAQVKDGVSVEIHPNWALDLEDVRQKISPGLLFEADTYLR